MKNFLITFVLCVIVFTGYSFISESKVEPEEKAIIPTVLISIDGFANHYLETYKPKNILKLAATGVRAKSMIPVFPSKTFPNHISIVTGNYPATHGVVHNKFYNRDLDKEYKLGLGKEDPRWLRTSTLWSIAEQNNIKTGIYFWPESEANISKNRPTYLKPYKHNTPNKDRFDTMVEWLSLPEEQRPSLVLGYFSTVDTAGHEFGTDSEELKSTIADLDILLGEFLHDLETKLDYDVNIVLVSDHGMSNISTDTIATPELLKGIEGFDDIRVVNGQTQLYVYLDEENPEREQKLVQIINNKLNEKQKNQINVYDFASYPQNWHFNTRSSVLPNLILEVAPPYVFGVPKEQHGATHGYDPRFTSKLNAIFIANGPSFKQGIEINAFENIHVFSLMLSILGVDLPETTDVKDNVLSPILN